MLSFSDLLNPTFLMFLGILILVVALLVVYFESKIREQNHKISSMLSLVSSLAEEVNGVKFGINHLIMRGGINDNSMSQEAHLEEQKQNNTLITVSDDEDDDEDEDEETDLEEEDLEEEEEDLEEEEEDLENEETDSEDGSIDLNNDIKILKLNINNDTDDVSEENNDLEFENADDLEYLDDIEDMNDLEELKSASSKSSRKSEQEKERTFSFDEIKKIDQDQYEETNQDHLQILDLSSSDLKKININLEENIDYKKLSLAKLRNIVTEKGLAIDTSKMKKNELLKLLEVE
jgi:hypothetical protein